MTYASFSIFKTCWQAGARALVLLVGLGATAATAQMSVDFSMVGSSVSGITTPVVLNPCPGGQCASSRGSSASRGVAPSAAAAAVDTRYRPTPALARAALDGYVSRIKRTDPDGAAQVAEQFSQHDYGRIYGGIVAPFGYRTDDLADAMAAYTLLGWLVATGSGDPSPQAAAAVRAQVAARLATNPKLTTPTNRAALGEELKLLFVTLHAGWQSARRDGSLAQFSDGVNALFRKQGGQDLRALRLTDRGFVEG